MTNDTSVFYKQLESDAQLIAGKAMKILEAMQGTETLAVQKDEMDISTSADLAAEKCIVDFIKSTYPTHGIYSEELGTIKGTEPFRWVIDPLDQTKEYFRGLTEYNCLIGIEYDDIPVVGVTIGHGVNTVYEGSKGNGSFLNTHRMHVSNQTNFDNTFIGYNLPNKKMNQDIIKSQMSHLNDLISRVYRVRPFWDQSKAMGWVARGALDGNIAPPGVWKWYDIASSIILVEEAGGTVTDYLGNPVTEKTSKNGIIASNGKIHSQLLSIIQGRLQ